MGKATSKRRLPEEDDEEPAQGSWLTSYSDMISLLFALFVVLYGMSKVNEESFRQLSEALSNSLSTGGAATRVPHKMMATDNVQEGGKEEGVVGDSITRGGGAVEVEHEGVV